MSHELVIDREGRAAFCYNAKNGDPWHRLGESKPGGFTLTEGLRAARMNRDVEKVTLWAMTPGGMVETDVYATVWPSIDDPDVYDVLGAGLSADYRIFQYRHLVEVAMAVVGATADDAILDTLGLLFDGKRAFGFIDFGDLLVELPNGAVDRSKKGLGFMGSHDASQSSTFWTTRIRAVCNNTVTAGMAMAGSGIVRIRHTGDQFDKMAQVPELLRLAYGGDEEFTEMVRGLAAAPGGHDVLAKVINKLWAPPEPGDSERAKSIWRNRSEKLHQLYEAPSNEPAVGANAYAVYNTVAEFFDHVVGTDEDRRARASITPGSGTDVRKVQALQVLSRI